MRYPLKEIAWNFFTVCIGVTGSVGFFYFLFLATAILPNTFNTIAFLMLPLGLSSFAGGYATASLATRHKFILSLITTFLLIVIYIDWFDSNFTDRNYPDELLPIAVTFFLSLFGGLAGSLPSRKNRKSKQVDTSSTPKTL